MENKNLNMVALNEEEITEVYAGGIGTALAGGLLVEWLEQLEEVLP